MCPDKFSKETRSKIMSSIHSKDTKIELLLRSLLWKEGLRYRTHYMIKGNPDIVFTRQKVAVFIDGDFWHGWQWKKLKPKLKNRFWVDKITRNMERDKEVNKELKEQGWRVIRIWEHSIKRATHKNGKTLKSILNHASKSGYYSDWKILNAANFGIPQRRERLIMIGLRDREDIEFPKPTHFSEGSTIGYYDKSKVISVEPTLYGSVKIKKAVTTWEAISDLPPPRIWRGEIRILH